MAGIRIIGSGHSLPKVEVSSSHLEHEHDLPPGYLLRKTGVSSRYYCTSESQIDLAVEAALSALRDADIEPYKIDMVVGGCGIPYQTLPATAPLVQRALDIDDGAALSFDVSSTCLSFLNAFDYAALMLRAGRVRTVLVFSADMASRALPWQDDPETASLFGDGAAAVILRRCDDGGIYHFNMKTFPSGYDDCQIAAGGTRINFKQEEQRFFANAVFRMNGRNLFKLTRSHFSDFVDETLAKAGWGKDDVDLVIPHQASPQALSHMIKLTGFSPDKVVNIAAEYGNQIAASIPTCLDMARRAGDMKAGSKVLMIGTSAGVSFGALTLEVCG